MKLPLATLPTVSVALQLTVVVAIEKVAPDAGLQVTTGLTGSTSVEVAEKVTVAPELDVASCVIFEGRLKSGAAVSTVNEFTERILLAFVAASVTRIVQFE